MSDGIIAGGFEPEALEILKAKKQGKFIVLKANESFKLPEFEYRTSGHQNGEIPCDNSMNRDGSYYGVQRRCPSPKMF